MTTGERIVHLRHHLGMTQAELGAEIGFTGSHVSKLERGLTEPSEEIIFSICNVTSARYEWLKNEDGPMFANEIPPVDYASVGLRIRNARKAQGLTQLELAERMGSSKSMVNAAELGKLTPSNRWLKKMAEVCHVSMQWILTGSEENGEKQLLDQSMKQIDDFLRTNEIARIAVMEAINSDDSGIWLRLEQLIRERKQEG